MTLNWAKLIQNNFNEKWQKEGSVKHDESILLVGQVAHLFAPLHTSLHICTNGGLGDQSMAEHYSK